MKARPDLPPESRVLRDALVEAYRPHLAERLDRAGLPRVPEHVVAAGEGWLAAELDELLGLPFDSQPRGPLELFQEAMRFPSEALLEAGAEPPSRDPVEESALPGDLYRLAPASSADLGEVVWRAHLAWGAAKAGAVVLEPAGETAPATVEAPRALLIGANLLDRGKIEAAVRATGYRFEAWTSLPDPFPRPGADPPAVAFVDLEHRQADLAVRLLARAGVRTYAFGPHVDDTAMVRARTLGAVDALPRSRFFRVIDELLPQIA